VKTWRARESMVRSNMVLKVSMVYTQKYTSCIQWQANWRRLPLIKLRGLNKRLYVVRILAIREREPREEIDTIVAYNLRSTTERIVQTFYHNPHK
jgi:hypothetical protein